MLQAVVRERGTINDTARIGVLRGRCTTWKMLKLEYQELCAGSCAMEGGAMQHSRKVTVGVTFHDLTTRRRLRGVGYWHLRTKYLKIHCQNNIND